jgi:hypothetical protein
MAPAPTSAFEEQQLPRRVLAAVERGLALALAGRPSTISDRLWAYEIEDAARRLVRARGLVGVVRIETNGEKVSFKAIRA